MGLSSYAALSRQSGLINEMQIISNNIANSATTGYRQEGLVFSEYLDTSPGRSSVALARGQVRNTSMAQGALTRTDGRFDFAIEGDGFFLVETPDGERLTRAGRFSANADGDLVDLNGHRVLDDGGSPVFVPSSARTVSVAADCTISADSQPVGRIGVYKPTDPNTLQRGGGVLFHSTGGIDPVDDARVLQGFLEGSNVDPILQMARMIEVQRAYELGQSFLQAEDQRIRDAVRTLIRQS